MAEKEYTILDLEANYYQKVEPLQYTVKLVLGILAALFTLNWMAQMYVFRPFLICFCFSIQDIIEVIKGGDDAGTPQSFLNKLL